LRPEFWHDIMPTSAGQLVEDGTPSFSTLEPFRPRTSALIHGIVLTTSLFVLTCFAIRYSWIHVLHVHIPVIEFESSPSIHPASPSQLRGTDDGLAKSDFPSRISQFEKTPAHLYVEPMPVEAEPPVPVLEVARTNGNSFAASVGQPVQAAVTLALNLESYAGIYVSNSPHHTITILASKQQLLVKVDRQAARVLSPLSETTFVMDEAGNSEIEFGSAKSRKFYTLRLSEPGSAIAAHRE